MTLNRIEAVDLLQDVTIFWVGLSDIPGPVQAKAQKIDDQEYDPQGFEACVGYDLTKNEFFFFTGEDISRGGGNIYYVDADGDKHWFQVEIGEELSKQIFDACDRINNCIDTPQGYTIQKTVQFDRDFGLVLAKKDDPIYPFTSWQFKEAAKGRRDYVQGHHYADEKTAEKAFANAIAERTEHERVCLSREAKATTWGSGKKPTLREQLAAAKEALAEQPNAQRRKKDKEAR